MDIKCECESEDYKCHLCHDGDDTFDFMNDQDKWKVVHLEKFGLDLESERGTECRICKKCKTEYYKSWFYDDGGAGGNEWKVLEDGTEIQKHKPRKNYHEPLECNY
ncbi:MAG: hypothetical protein GTO02_16415 [Candidatus Dadabacteria bacterium]|nr:hypothetical protein [Candidatus Dadabacteria bacterium]